MASGLPTLFQSVDRRGQGNSGTLALAEHDVEALYNPSKGPAAPETDEGLSSADEERSVAPCGTSSLAQDLQGLASLFASPLNLLLLAVPLGIASAKLEWGYGPTFLFNFLGIIPLAALLGETTENLAMHTGELIGGLINATFGNAVEMIFTVQMLRAGLITVVQESLLGSVLSNLLLVLGTAFLLGGMRYSEQSFNLKGAGSNLSCLFLSFLAIALPKMFGGYTEAEPWQVLLASRVCAVVVVLMYVLFLVFQLKTHTHLFMGEGEEEQAPQLSAGAAVAMLLVITAVVAYCTEFLVEAIDGVTTEYKVSRSFIGVILLPIVGNAAEHWTAVTAAMKNKMDLTIGVAVGSSTQISLFVMPFSVLLGWCMGVPMDLNFRGFEMAAMLFSLIIVGMVLQDGCTNWLEGAMLMATYILMACMFFLMPGEPGHGPGSHAAAADL